VAVVVLFSMFALVCHGEFTMRGVCVFERVVLSVQFHLLSM
jgi:hypothetical protein